LASLSAPIAHPDVGSTSESLFAWLERSEPVWRSLHYFDKPGEALSNLPTPDDAALRDPLIKALAGIASAKRLRELGAYGRSKRALEVAASASRKEKHLPVRQHLLAQCSLHHAWLSYRRGDLGATERCLASVDAIATSGALLRLRGQVLNLRSLVKRSRGLYGAALDDLRHAARLFVADGDLFHLLAVYHNLACLMAANASEVSDVSERCAMWRLALSYSQRNEAYCRRYEVGQNSVLNKLLQVGLHRALGQAGLAQRIACEAERLALESQNFPDALKAHRHRIAILLEGQQVREAREAMNATVNALRDPVLKRQFARIYEEELARASTRLPGDGLKPMNRPRSRRAHSI